MTRQRQFEFIPAAFTPFSEEGAIELAGISLYVDYLTENAIPSVFINGTTGESLSLTTDERMQLTDAWCRFGQNRLRIIDHVGHNCIGDAQRLAQHAEQCGVEAIACMAPTFFLPRSVEELLDSLEPIAAAAPATDFYFYHMPSLTGVHVPMEEFIAKAAVRMATFAGVKYTHEDICEFQTCEARWGDRYRIFFGRDELLLPALGVGARGGVGSIYGLTPKLFTALAKSFFEGELVRAMRLSNDINQFINVLKQSGVQAGGKALLAQLGIGSGVVRLPLKTYSERERCELLRAACELPLDGEKWKSHHTNQPAPTPPGCV